MNQQNFIDIRRTIKWDLEKHHGGNAIKISNEYGDATVTRTKDGWLHILDDSGNGITMNYEKYAVYAVKDRALTPSLKVALNDSVSDFLELVSDEEIRKVLTFVGSYKGS